MTRFMRWVLLHCRMGLIAFDAYSVSPTAASGRGETQFRPTRLWHDDNSRLSGEGAGAHRRGGGGCGTMRSSISVSLGAVTMKSILALLLYLPATVFAQTALDSWYGKWTGRYSGGDSGTCSITISFSTMDQAAVGGSCISDFDQQTSLVSGQISSNGGVSLTAGTASNGAQFSGILQGTSGSGQWVNLLFGVSGTWTISKLPAPFLVDISGEITDTSATVITRIRFNASDVGKPGAVFVTAWVPVGALGTLGISAALNSQLSVTGTRDNPNLADTANSLRMNQGPLAEMDASAFVLVQLTSSGWQLVVNGQLVPYASGVLGDQLAAQTILDNTDTANLKGGQFCLGYGSSANDMIAAGRVQLIATVPDPNSTSAATGTCLVTTLPVYRFFNNNAGGHFYTINEAEKDTVIQNYNWFRYEGVGFYAYPAP